MILALAYGLVAVFGFLGLFVHPGWALFGYFIVAFGRPGELDWTLFGRSLSMPIVGAAFLGTLIYFARKGYPKVGSIQMKLLALMLLHFWLAGKILDSPYVQLFGHSRPVRPIELWDKFGAYMKMAAVLFVGSRVLLEPKWIQRMLVAFGLCGGLLAVWANYHYFIVHTYPITGPGPPAGIPAGIFADRNDFCILLSMSMVTCWYLAVLSRSWVLKAFWLGFLPFILHTILLTESRGGLLGAGVGMAVCTWRSKHRWSLSLLGAVGMLCALLFFTNAKLLERYGTIKNFEEDSSALGRLNSWNVGWRMMWGNPLFGAGLENYMELFYDYTEWRPRWVHGGDGVAHVIMDDEYEINRARQAHNMWVQRGGEAGVLGVVLLAWFIFSVPVDVFRIRRWLGELRMRGRLGEEDADRALALANCLDGMMLPYLLTGFFLSMEDFEGLYLVGLLTGCLTNWVRTLRNAPDPVPEPLPPRETV